MIISLLSSSQVLADADIPIEFWGETIHFSVNHPIQISSPHLNDGASVYKIEQLLIEAGVNKIAQQINGIVSNRNFCDWLTYQLIRKAAHQIISKNNDYLGYTVTKWYLLKKLGFDPLLILTNERTLLYIKSNDIVYNIPYRTINGKQYICLNYHDYGYTTQHNGDEKIIQAESGLAGNNFTFNISQLPFLESTNYVDQDLSFEYGQQKEHIKIKINTSLKNYFTNYPVTDYDNQFNIPLSFETKQSLINALKQKVKNLSTKQGVEYIMYFTRYAFIFEKDADFFGREKRLSPEETLLYGKSDCEDRSALFYALIKEIYNMPMIVLSYPDHVAVAVKLDKPIGKPIVYENELYTLCEPTPQKTDVRLGERLSDIHDQAYEIAFSYKPLKK